MEKKRLSTPVLLFITFSSSFTKISSKPIRVPLIHRDSPLSPHHDPNLSLYDRNRASFARSIARHAAASTSADGGGFVLTPPLTPEMGEYYTRFWVGTPQVLSDLAGGTGLARGPLSLTNQLLVKTFSYCLGFRGDQDEEGSPSFLLFGDDIPMKGNSTPMYRAQGRETQYTISVDSITLGGDQIYDTQFQITGPWRRPGGGGGGGGGPVIDSGTEMTIIDTRAFNFIYDAVRGAVKTGLKEVDDPKRQSELCYEATMDDFETVPYLGFHFRGGAELVLCPMKMFVPVRDDIVCLAVLRSYNGLSIIGNVAQQNYMVGFDLDRELIYFEPYM
ncbi:Aspartic proteinase CDR1 [Acorus calamus]|uniref:Aspartic proteinase CDR1 n=1 Tax=Acorus calamus TaxID=4465 RepID=A0AAV9EKM4_ACOCL|nr:Aspartic proteinase CDR1 [Acorus calamus]